MSYSEEQRNSIVDHVLAEVATGRPVSRIIEEDDGMPDRTTFWSWVRLDDQLSNNLACAREAGVEAIVDEAITIADDKTYDTRKAADGSEVANTEWISRSRLRVETRLKLAAMIKPRKYGPKVDVTSGGEAIGVDLDPVARATRLASIFATIEKQREGGGDAD